MGAKERLVKRDPNLNPNRNRNRNRNRNPISAKGYERIRAIIMPVFGRQD